MTTRLNILLVALIVLVAVPYYWLLIDDRPGVAEAKPISIGQLRAAAQAIAGQKPVTIRYEGVAARKLPRIFFAAGQGIKLTVMEARGYRLEYPGQPPIVIDGGMSLFSATGLDYEAFATAAQVKIAKAEEEASLIVHMDAEPLQRPTRGRSVSAQGVGESGNSTSCSVPQALAPGLVEIPICDNVLAKRLIFVHLDDGREYLLTGEIAPAYTNVETRAGPSRLMNDYFFPQDRTAIHNWLLTIDRLRRQAPDMRIVPGHDKLPFEVMRRGFTES